MAKEKIQENIDENDFELEEKVEEKPIEKSESEEKRDSRGPYFQKSSQSKKRYFDPDKPMDRERARRVSSRD